MAPTITQFMSRSGLPVTQQPAVTGSWRDGSGWPSTCQPALSRMYQVQKYRLKLFQFGVHLCASPTKDGKYMSVDRFQKSQSVTPPHTKKYENVDGTFQLPVKLSSRAATHKKKRVKAKKNAGRNSPRKLMGHPRLGTTQNRSCHGSGAVEVAALQNTRSSIPHPKK